MLIALKAMYCTMHFKVNFAINKLKIKINLSTELRVLVRSSPLKGLNLNHSSTLIILSGQKKIH